MLPELREQLAAKTEANVEREYERLEYITSLVENNEQTLRDAFLTEDIPEEEVPMFLFNKTVEGLRAVESKLLQSVGVTTSRRPYGEEPAEQGPLFKLGWMQWVPYNPEKVEIPLGQTTTHVLLATMHGREIVDGLRAAQGYVNIQEQRRINKERSSL